MTCGLDVFLTSRRTGKRKLAKELVMDTGQLRPGDVRNSCLQTAGVQSDCVTTCLTVMRCDCAPDTVIPRGDTGYLFRVQCARMAELGTDLSRFLKAVTIVIVIAVLLPCTAAQGRNAPIITIRQGSLEGVSTIVICPHEPHEPNTCDALR